MALVHSDGGVFASETFEDLERLLEGVEGVFGLARFQVQYANVTVAVRQGTLVLNEGRAIASEALVDHESLLVDVDRSCVLPRFSSDAPQA